jgi:hypothetical protein
VGQSHLAVHAGSAFGGMAFDSLIAPWFAGALSFLRRPHAAMRAAGA